MKMRALKPKTLIVMQGIPGSGKSTIAEMIALGSHDVQIRSTDEFWGENYNFNAALLGRAHEWNQDRVKREMVAGTSTIIVDNTNIKKSAVEPYVEMANQFGYTVQFVRVSVPVDVAVGRNAMRPKHRRVPEEVIRRMAEEMENLG